MNHIIKGILLLMSSTVLLISACEPRILDAAAAPEIEKNQIESIQVQTPISPTGPIESIGELNPGNFPQQTDQDIFLDQVNRGGPEH
jgi:hypothetical protein